ncbi:MAG: hypothetical protein AAB839_01590 [Patescibacteria group bacterium]
MRFLLPGLLALAACDGGTDNDSETVACSTCGDDTSSIDNQGYMLVDATVFGSLETMSVFIDGVAVGQTGSEIALDPGSYTITIGDDATVTSADGISLHVSQTTTGNGEWVGSRWIAPEIDITIASGQTVTMIDDATNPETEDTADDAVAMNIFASGLWSCWRDDSDLTRSDEIRYLHGNLVSPPSVTDDMGVASTNVALDPYYTGNFTSPTRANFHAQDGSLQINWDCWIGDEDARPE